MKLEDRLPEALARIADTTLIDRPGSFDPEAFTLADSTERATPLWRPLIGVAAVAVVGVGGLVAISATRDHVDAPAATPPPLTTTADASAAPQPGPVGALVPPADSSLHVVGAEVGSFAADSPSRWYATPIRSPEVAPYLRIGSYANDVPAGFDQGCELSDTAARDIVLDDGTIACFAAPGDRLGAVYLRRSPYSIVIEGSVGEVELITAANHVASTPDAPGFEILSAGLPPGVEQTGGGWGVSDFAAVSFEAADDPMVSTHWEDDTGRTIFAVVTTDDVAWLGNHRLGYDTVTDVTVRGAEGFLRTYADQPSYVGLVWHEGGLTYVYGGQGFTSDELLAEVELLHPATADEWDTIVAAVPEPDLVTEEAPATTVAVTASVDAPAD